MLWSREVTRKLERRVSYGRTNAEIMKELGISEEELLEGLRKLEKYGRAIERESTVEESLKYVNKFSSIEEYDKHRYLYGLLSSSTLKRRLGKSWAEIRRGGGPLVLEAGGMKVYLLYYEAENLYKIGITENIIKRFGGLTRFNKYFKLIDYQGMTKVSASAVETAILEAVKEYAREPVNRTIIRGGHTEFFELEWKPKSILDLLSRLNIKY